MRFGAFFLLVPLVVGCMGGTAAIDTNGVTREDGSSGRKGPAIDPRCEAGGVVFEESGKNSYYPYETANLEVDRINAIAPSDARIAFGRGKEITSFGRGERAGKENLSVLARSERGSTEGLAVTGSRFVWFGDAGVSWTPTAPGGAIASIAGVQRAVFDGDSIFLASRGAAGKTAITRSDASASAPTPLAEIDGELTVYRHLLTQDADAIYIETWEIGETQGPGVYRVAKADGKATKLRPTARGMECGWAVVDGENVVAACPGSDRRDQLVRFSKTDGSGFAVIGNQLSLHDRPVLQDGALYGLTGLVGEKNRRLVRVDLTTGSEREMLPPRAAEETLDAFAREGRCFYAAVQKCSCVEMTSRFNKGTGGTDQVCGAASCTNRIERFVEPM